MNLTQPLASFSLAAFAALGIFLLPARPACAQALFSVGNVVSAAPGGSGSFDVLLTATSGSLSIGAFTAEPTLSAPGVTFTAAGFNTVTPYIFPDSFDQDNGLTLTDEADDPFPNTDLIASDSDNQSGSAVTLTSGSTVGLAHVTYMFDSADTPGSVYTVNFNPNGTSLSDGTGTVSYSFTTAPGVLTVGPAAVPEASSVISLGLLLALGAGAVAVKRRRKAVAPDVVMP